MTTMKFTPRQLYLAGFLASVGLMAAALVFQYVIGLVPCPLCIVQRWFVIAIGVVLLAAALHNPRAVGQRLYGLAVMVFALLGAAVAGRHVWIEHQPPESLGCGADLEYMLQNFPLLKTVTLLWAGTSDCATVTWRFLGFSMASWMVLCFAGFAVLGVALTVYAKSASAAPRS
ncbi:MAG: disulfide bond formation protein B [Gammaproteobacteria bacterium]|nr:disulfide bond formation protein B [Gammaproteobacteria bacterium]